MSSHRISLILLAALILLSLASGVAKILQLPQEIEFFGTVGLNPAAVSVFGGIQVLGGALLIFTATRRIGAALMILTFGFSTFLIFMTGTFGFGLFSIMPILVAGLFIRRPKQMAG